MFENKMLVCDMDGTLLNSSLKISDENIAALRRFTENGGLFTVATGRMHIAMLQYLSKLPINIPAILFNGAMIYDFFTEESIWERPLPDEVKLTVIEILAEFPAAAAEVYQGDKIYLLNENAITERHIKQEKTNIARALIDKIPFPWIKVLIAGDNGTLCDIEQWLAKKKLSFRHTFSEKVMLELLNNEASKGHALVELARMTGTPLENTYAMGDNLNDIEMIRMAGAGIAVSNAHPDIKAAADICMPHHDEHAVAHVVEWIERLSLAHSDIKNYS
jgi:Cof subfamily protein (haloacid dehalogenase superfamily)